jgi:protein-tyrosine phosphatase
MGRLALAARPRGGEWLPDELANWKRQGIECVLSLLTPDEEYALSLTHESSIAREQGLDFVSFPIQDRDVPETIHPVDILINQMLSRLACGTNIVIHCRQGMGRTGLIAACLLVSEGTDPEKAIEILTTLRGVELPETPQQRQWVRDFGRR